MGRLSTGARSRQPISQLEMTFQHPTLLNREVTDAMQTADRLADTAHWLRYAEEDLITAEILLKQLHLPPRQAYLCAQQTTEKALKAFLIFLQIDFPRTDDLNILWNLVPHNWQFKMVQSDLTDITGCVADVQYPGDMPEPTQAEASEAVEQTRAIWTSISTALAQRGFHAPQNL